MILIVAQATPERSLRGRELQSQTATLPTKYPTGQPSTSYPTVTPAPTNTRIPFDILIFPTGDVSFPLGVCQGNCLHDYNCDSGLYCFQRSPNQDVPGCNGGNLDPTYTNYCVYSDKPMPPVETSPTGEFFRLKLYWQPGYRWQGELFERKWCMKCRWGCYDGHPLYITPCSGYSTYFTFVTPTTGTGDEVMIQVNGTNLCVHRQGGSPKVYLRTCNETLEHQRWFAKNGSFSGDKFEISQHSFSNYSLGQQHHPKDGEILYMQESYRAENATTQFWNKD